METQDETKAKSHGVNCNPENPTKDHPQYENLPRGPPGSPSAPGPYGPPLFQPAIFSCPAVMITQQMGPKPTRMKCESCQKDIETRIEYRATIRTHIFAAALCAFGCIPCALIPYCMDSFQKADYYCPNCNTYIGSYNTC